MSTDLTIVAVSGSLHYPSKTTSLVTELAHRLGERLDATPHLVRIDEVGPQLAGALRRSELPPEVEAQLRAIETADLLVVASPVYRASFTGLFKHLFDFVDQYALVDTPVLLAATGGSERHALIIEHQFRPLFGFFQALTLPIGVYAHDSDFEGSEISSPRLIERIDKAVAKSMPIIASSLNERREIQRAIDGELERVPEPDVRKPVRLET